MVSIILINFNNSHDTIDCLESLKTINYPSYNVVVVDNASKEEDYNKLSRFIEDNVFSYPLKLIRSNNNLGFAGGNNLGIKYAIENLNPKYFMLLNNDTLVESNLIEELINNIDETHQMSTPKIVFEKERDIIWANGGYINSKRGIGVNKDFLNKDELSDKSYSCDFSPFCCVLYTRKLHEELGYMDDSYFMYFEDVDYCIKMKQKGYLIKYTPKTIVYHKVSASSGGLRSNFYLEWMTRNQKRIIKKYFNKKVLRYFYFYTFLKINYYLLKLKFASIKAIRKGLKK